MRHGLSLIPLLLLSGAIHAAAPTGYDLVWSDHFSGTSLDTTKWNYRATGVRRSATNTPDAVSVNNGLTIRTYTSGGVHYTGMIGTQNTFQATYGYFEAEIAFTGRSGMWSAFWLQAPGNVAGAPASAGVEYDIVEARSAPASGNLNNASHYGGYSGGTVSASNYPANGPAYMNGTYHTYGFLWTPSATLYYLDGVQVWAGGATPALSRGPEYLILSSEVEDAGWAGNIPAGGYGEAGAGTNAEMNVRSVSVYQAVPESAGFGALALVGFPVLCGCRAVCRRSVRRRG